MKVFFCPYLSAMWTSMSTLYDEHIAAGDDVTVMPLPYFIKDPSKAPIEHHLDKHFEVPTIEPNYEVLKKANPDILYFHNPYDNFNKVTLIDPKFFSKQLKKCTKKLVYVPYYTIAESDGIDMMLAPGVLNADKIIVFSEQTKTNYATAIKSHTGQNWGSKIIVKNVSIINNKHYEIPNDWAKIANGRRLVLLNTSVVALVVYKDEEFVKVRKVIEENQNDQVCLVWRPHPLYMATISAMVPYLKDKYLDLVHDFIENKKGIFDTSSDLQRAIHLCEEYIGDGSSLVAMFKEQDKPVTVI